MESQYANELDLIVGLIAESGRLSRRLFHSEDFEVFTKGNSRVTSIDFAVHNYVTGAAQSRGIPVRSEEAGSTGRYGEDRIFDLDPIDNTRDLIEGYLRQPRRAKAAPSLGFWDKEPVAGAVIFPLLGVAPIMYFASKNGGAYRDQNGSRTLVKINTAPTRGIVFVNSKTSTSASQELNQRLRQMGYTPVPEHGAVFKACGVLDNELLKQYPHHEAGDLAIPVVGCITQKAYLHDVAATTCLIWEAGGVATAPQNHGDKQVWVAANNQSVYNDLVGLLV